MRERLDLKAGDRPSSSRRLAATVDLHPVAQLVENDGPETAFDKLLEYFLPCPPRVDYAALRPYLQKDNRDNLLKTMVMRLLSLPEYQMC